MTNKKITSAFEETKHLNQKWQNKVPHIDDGPIDYATSISKEQHKIEREAIFKRSWLCVGRETLIEKKGSYFTRDLDFAKAPIIILRNEDNEIKSFYNVCPHRGNKLVWRDNPDTEIFGRTNKFQCGFHGLTFDLNGKLQPVIAKERWSEKQSGSLCLRGIATATWNGFIFINLSNDKHTPSLKEYIGEPFWSGFSDFPFGKFTRSSTVKGTANCNWKILHDMYSEASNAGTLHHKILPGVKNSDVTFTALDHSFPSENIRLWSLPRLADNTRFFNIQKLANIDLAGVDGKSNRDISSFLPGFVNPSGKEWSFCIIFVFPNMILQFVYPSLIQIQTFWPIEHNTMNFETTRYHFEPENFSSLFSQRTGDRFFSEVFRHSLSTAEAVQNGIESGTFSEFPLSDEEIQVRYSHWDIKRRIASFLSTEASSSDTQI